MGAFKGLDSSSQCLEDACHLLEIDAFCQHVEKQYENALFSDNNAAADKLKPVTSLEEQILLQIGTFLQNLWRV